jgi:hypothetical protein
LDADWSRAFGAIPGVAMLEAVATRTGLIATKKLLGLRSDASLKLKNGLQMKRQGRRKQPAPA